MHFSTVDSFKCVLRCFLKRAASGAKRFTGDPSDLVLARKY
jgi:hypothetical protein